MKPGVVFLSRVVCAYLLHSALYRILDPQTLTKGMRILLLIVPQSPPLETQNPELETSNRDPIGYGSTTRKGKVARLPVSIREIVNRMLENGSRFQDIIARLDDLGYPGFQPPNISRWKSGGYLDWL